MLLDFLRIFQPCFPCAPIDIVNVYSVHTGFKARIILVICLLSCLLLLSYPLGLLAVIATELALVCLLNLALNWTLS